MTTIRSVFAFRHSNQFIFSSQTLMSVPSEQLTAQAVPTPEPATDDVQFAELEPEESIPTLKAAVPVPVPVPVHQEKQSASSSVRKKCCSDHHGCETKARTR